MERQKNRLWLGVVMAAVVALLLGCMLGLVAGVSLGYLLGSGPAGWQRATPCPELPAITPVCPEIRPPVIVPPAPRPPLPPVVPETPTPVVPQGPTGARVIQVNPETPAERAGLRPGDLITAVNDQPVTPDMTLARLLVQYEPGERVLLSVLRGREELHLVARLAESPSVPGRAYLGVLVEDPRR